MRNSVQRTIPYLRRLGFLLGISLAGTAQAGSIVPQQAQICDDNHIVDKNKLATFLLDTAPVSRQLEDWAQANPRGWTGLTARQRLIADPDICTPVNGKVPDHCAATDAANLATARQNLISLLMRQPQSFENVSRTFEPKDYFGTASQLRCVRSGPTDAPVEVAGAIGDKFDLKFPLRIRGAADGIYFARTDAQFKSQEKATISFSHNYVKSQQSEKFSVVAGYPVQLVDTGLQTAEIAPYAGISRDITKTDGEDPKVSANLWRIGAALDLSITSNHLTHWLVARPEYLFNDKEKSEVAAINFTYMPVINGVLNDYRYVIPGNNHFMSLQPILDLRLNGGTFTRLGSRSEAESHDYIRAGGQAGIAFSSDVIPFPADLTVTQTYLPALSAHSRDLHYFKAVLSLGVDKDRVFGVDISYVDGRREDLLDSERAWTISFGLKY